MVLLGGGAVDADAEAIAVAERLDAPVALSLNAKGTVPDDHPLSVGTSLPATATMDALRDADAVLAIGTELCDVDFYYAPEPLRLDGALIRIDIDPAQLDAGLPAAVGIHADARAALTALAAALGPRGAGAAGAGAARAAEIRRGVVWWERARPLLPLVEEIGRALPRDAVVVADSTQLAYIGQNAWPAWRTRSWLIPAGWGTLGPALPMAIGAAVGAPGRPVIAVAGDGGLLFTIGEMSAAAELDLPLVLLLWNNGGYGEMRDEMDALGIPHVGTSASAHDYVAIARGFGWSAERAGHADIATAIARAVARGTPSLIELSP
jgi:acetolactate synthase-1/2/3 large subunit